MKNIQEYSKLNKEERKVEVFKGAVEMFSKIYPQLKISFKDDSFKMEGGTETLRKKCSKDIETFFNFCRI